MSAFPPLSFLLVTLSAWFGMSSDGVEPRLLAKRVIVSRDVVIHIPIAQHREHKLKWVEHKGPKCVPAAMIAGAAMVTPSTIDFVLRDRSRVRARLDKDCAGLDFYGGFYVEPNDQAVCARREEIRSRAGSTCRIERFRSLEPKYKR